MEKLEQKVVQDVTTKKKYVKPDFEVIELNMEAPLLSASGDNANASGKASFGNNSSLSEAIFGNN